MRKYCDYYISVSKKEKGFIWKIWSNMINGEVLQSSMDETDEDDRYFVSKEVAYQEAAENVQYYYS